VTVLVLVLVAVCIPIVSGTPSGLYQDDGDGHTILAQKFTRRDVREMSFDLLSLMGFQQRPRPHLVETHSPASQFLYEVYESLSEGEEGLSRTPIPMNLSYSRFNVHSEDIKAIRKADAIVSFLNRGHKYASLLRDIEEEKSFWFDVTEVFEAETVLGAELRIWKKSLRRGNEGDVFRIAVSVVKQNKEGSYELEEVDEVVAAAWEEGWLRLNVTESFRDWIRDPGTNYGLVLSTKRADTGHEVMMGASGLGTLLDVEEFQPFLVSFLVGGGKVRPKVERPPKRRRVVRDATEGRKRGRKSRKRTDFEDMMDRPRSCQMGMLYVNFEDLGWKDWVIAPDGFIAYYCTGECSFPLTAAMNATNHAIVSTLVHTYYPQEFPKPSCAPLKLGSISMLYYDDGSNVTVKKYKDMVIKSCGCK